MGRISAAVGVSGLSTRGLVEAALAGSSPLAARGPLLQPRVGGTAVTEPPHVPYPRPRVGAWSPCRLNAQGRMPEERAPGLVEVTAS